MVSCGQPARVGRSPVSDPKSAGKPFAISKQAVVEAFRKVRDNQGGPGVGGCTIEEFEADLRNRLYVTWNRLSSGTYFPPPVKLVEVPKPHGLGTRRLGVPTEASYCPFPQRCLDVADGGCTCSGCCRLCHAGRLSGRVATGCAHRYEPPSESTLWRTLASLDSDGVRRPR